MLPAAGQQSTASIRQARLEARTVLHDATKPTSARLPGTQRAISSREPMAPGLVYRISPEGKGYVLFEAPRREITAMAVAANGTIYAASVGDKTRNPLPPLPVQGISTATITIVQPASLQAANTSTPYPKEPRSMPSTKTKPRASSGPARTISSTPSPRGRRPAGAHRQPRTHLQHSDRRQLLRHCAPEAQQGLSLAIDQTLRPTKPCLSAPATPASCTARRLGKARVRQRRLDAGALARSATSKWSLVLQAMRSSPAPAMWSSRSEDGPTGSRLKMA